ncbi:signal transduction histidine kinase [Saccharothrix ecbatanensis]|uniref:histidine kinase n=1 Tax=Saccharothrix ecbatanensis TaxID=1105145 RepID=A0A7W9HMC6_9PSEU|nr:nitrate- and nitrite sensing domain-containing protein [Saccharothrix ecbatanensis]MBB5804399.1 signal transduction histidine kinase [Saccharothrix ecbatanensis]
MTGDNNARRQWWSAVADWRNWRLPVKLAAVLAVPVLVAVGAGVVQIHGYVRSADNYASMQRIVTLRGGLDPLVAAVQAERALSARRPEGAGANAEEFPDLVRATDNAAAGVRNLMDRTTSLGEVANARFRDVKVQLDGLPQLRERVLSGSVDLEGSVGGYTVVLRALLDFDLAMVGDFGDPALSGTATALHNLAMASEQVSWQHATVHAGISRGYLLDTETTMLEQSYTRQHDKLADFTAVATPQQQADYRSTVAGQEVDLRNSLFQQIRTNSGVVEKMINPEGWDVGAESTLKQIDVVLRSLEEQLAAAAARLQDTTSDRAGAASVILLASLFAAAAVGYIIGSYLLRSLRTLRTAALDVAEHRLPKLVAQLRENAAHDITVEPVPVDTREELGQLARAFDAVHRQAVSSAAEQADLRTGMRNAFINLSRRSQGLVERQLKLMEELERQEENPEQLANLFKLDNLATRMRRNNENLMVLSGSDVARRFTRPVPLGDVLRAAASEIEQYQRVVVQTTPSVEVVGYAAGDLVRLVAELLDNATTFSPPRTQVVVGGRPRPGGGVLVDVVDVGVGMSEEDLAQANRRIALAASENSGELPVSRQLGLYVVGRLGGRHGIEVMLREQGEGLRAVVALPAELVRATGPLSARQVPAQASSPIQAALSSSSATSNAALSTSGLSNSALSTNALSTNGQAPFYSTGPQPALPHGVGPRAALPQSTSQLPAQPQPVSQPVSQPLPAQPLSPQSLPPQPALPPAVPLAQDGWAPFRGRTVDTPPPAPASPPRRTASTWFGGASAPAGPAEPARHRAGETHARGEAPVNDKPVNEKPVNDNPTELPKRQPRTNLVAERPNAQDAVAPVRRDPQATRGFLASYQTGIRQSVRGSGENRAGQENG